MQNKNKRVFKFVLTGGSCGGKTTTTRVLKDKLEKLGYNVFIIPEISTELDLKGYTLEKLGRKKWQEMILRWQIAKEDIIYKKANITEKPSIIICDRGALDGQAYVTESLFNGILNKLNLNKEELYKRYDLVFHMTSIALDFPEKYENTSNPMRREDIYASKIIDKRLKNIWAIHGNQYIVDNSTDLNGKINRVFSEIVKYVEKNINRDNER